MVRGIVKSRVMSAVSRSCRRKISPSLTKQVHRLVKADYPKELLSLIESCITGLDNWLWRGNAEETRGNCTPAAISYLHRTAHKLKNVACRHGKLVVLSVLGKLSALCRRTTVSAPVVICKRQHAPRFVECAGGVISIPPPCLVENYILGRRGGEVCQRSRQRRCLRHAFFPSWYFGYAL